MIAGLAGCVGKAQSGILPSRVRLLFSAKEPVTSNNIKCPRPADWVPGLAERRGLFGLEWILARRLQCPGKQDVVRGTELPGRSSVFIIAGD